eukprot:m.57215 g.57215  ORF g.57215 m.57215 type:complete len:161 (-) comp9341_c0_seq1:2165-2647(-)
MALKNGTHAGCGVAMTTRHLQPVKCQGTVKNLLNTEKQSRTPGTDLLQTTSCSLACSPNCLYTVTRRRFGDLRHHPRHQKTPPRFFLCCTTVISHGSVAFSYSEQERGRLGVLNRFYSTGRPYSPCVNTRRPASTLEDKSFFNPCSFTVTPPSTNKPRNV